MSVKDLGQRIVNLTGHSKQGEIQVRQKESEAKEPAPSSTQSKPTLSTTQKSESVVAAQPPKPVKKDPSGYEKWMAEKYRNDGVTIGEEDSSVDGEWVDAKTIEDYKYTCGWCGVFVKSDVGYKTTTYYADSHKMLMMDRSKEVFHSTSRIIICPNCQRPTYLSYRGVQYPLPKMEMKFDHVPADISKLFNEALDCCNRGSYTSTALVCRAIISRVAMDKGAPSKMKFDEHIDFLAEKGCIPTNSDWVHYIRKLGNFATHREFMATQEQGNALVGLTKSLLDLAYELPLKYPPPPNPPS